MILAAVILAALAAALIAAVARILIAANRAPTGRHARLPHPPRHTRSTP